MMLAAILRLIGNPQICNVAKRGVS